MSTPGIVEMYPNFSPTFKYHGFSWIDLFVNLSFLSGVFLSIFWLARNEIPNQPNAHR